MAEKVGNLAIIISGDSRQLMEAMSGAEQAIARFKAREEAKANRSSGFGIDGGALASGLMTRAAGAFAGVNLGREFLEVGNHALEMSRSYELAEMQLKTLTGSASSAKSVFAELRSLAPTTPYSVEDLSGVMRKMMGAGIAQSQALAATRQLAAVGAATGGDIASLGRAYAQVSAMGRLKTEEFNQFSDADFPVQEFAKTANMSMGEFRDAMEKGLVPVSVMEDTFKKLTESGGKFGTALDDLAKTAIGRKKAEDAAQEAYLANNGKRLEEYGASGRQIGNWWERKLSDSWLSAVDLFEVSFRPGGTIDPLGDLTKLYQKQQATAQAAADEARLAESRAKAAEDTRKAADAERQYREGMDSWWKGAASRDQAKVDAAVQADKDLLKKYESAPTLLDKFDELASAGRLEYGKGFAVAPAAALIEKMRAALPAQPKFSLPEAALRGSSQESATIARAIESIANKDEPKSAEQVLEEYRKFHAEQIKKQDDIIDELRKLSPATPARF